MHINHVVFVEDKNIWICRRRRQIHSIAHSLPLFLLWVGGGKCPHGNWLATKFQEIFGNGLMRLRVFVLRKMPVQEGFLNVILTTLLAFYKGRKAKPRSISDKAFCKAQKWAFSTLSCNPVKGTPRSTAWLEQKNTPKEMKFQWLLSNVFVTAFGLVFDIELQAIFSLAIIAFGAFGLIVPKCYCRLGKMELSLIIKEPRLLSLRRLRSSRVCAYFSCFSGQNGSWRS